MFVQLASYLSGSCEIYCRFFASIVGKLTRSWFFSCFFLNPGMTAKSIPLCKDGAIVMRHTRLCKKNFHLHILWCAYTIQEWYNGDQTTRRWRSKEEENRKKSSAIRKECVFVCIIESVSKRTKRALSTYVQEALLHVRWIKVPCTWQLPLCFNLARATVFLCVSPFQFWNALILHMNLLKQLLYPTPLYSFSLSPFHNRSQPF